MKRIFQHIRIFAINLSLIAIAVTIFIYSYVVIDLTLNPEHLNVKLHYFAFAIAFISYFILPWKRFKKYQVGILSVFVSVFIALPFVLNWCFRSEVGFVPVKVQKSYSYNDKYFIEIKYNHYKKIEVPLESFFHVDSIHFNTSTGLLGMQILKKDFKILENKECINSKDTASHLDYGNLFFHRRCFTKAIYHYTRSIEEGSSSNELYNQRGLAYMAMGAYEKAISDFYTYAISTIEKLDKTMLQSIHKGDHKTRVEELIEKLNKKDYTDIHAFFLDIETYYIAMNLHHCIRRIKFCHEKLEIVNPKLNL